MKKIRKSSSVKLVITHNGYSWEEKASGIVEQFNLVNCTTVNFGDRNTLVNIPQMDYTVSTMPTRQHSRID